MALDFRVTFNLVTRQLQILDLGSHGVEAGTVKINYKITSPAGVAWENTDFVNADSGGAGTFSIALPNAIDVPFPMGDWTVRQTARYVDPESGDQVLSRTFAINWSTPKMTLTELFDVYSPSLKYSDDTDYSVTAFNISSHTTAWNAVVGSVGSATGTAALFDLAVGGSYYDASYAITFQSDLTYNSSVYAYLYVVIRLSSAINTCAATPLTFDQMLQKLQDFYTLLQTTGASILGNPGDDEKYQLAESLLNNISMLTRNSKNNEISQYANRFYDVIDYVADSCPNAGTVIAPFGSGSAFTSGNDKEGGGFDSVMLG
jgi:hypothetical protein